MRLESARDLKQTLQRSMSQADVRTQRMRGEGKTNGPPQVNDRIALGITRCRRKGFALAVRVQSRSQAAQLRIDAIRRQARDEVDIRYVGRVNKRSTPWHRQATRPLLMGSSIGHFAVEAGTLGCFVSDRASSDVLVLSNNHVLAREGMAQSGDAILQPAPADGGDESRHTAGRLTRFQPLVLDGINHVDAAVGTIQKDMDYDHGTLSGLGQLAGLGDTFLDDGTEVAKIGRTTGLTRGRVTAFELDNVFVHFEQGTLRFDRQVEIEGSNDGPFSRAGDSGALIVDRDLRAVALLFAGTDFGGAHGEGLTYAHPLVPVLDSLDVDLLF